MARKEEVVVNTRIVNPSNIASSDEKTKKEYELLKNELRNRIEDDIRNKINTMKILLKIKDKSLYLLDGYRSFEEFLVNYKIAKTQAYKYLKLAELLVKGKLEEIELIKNGIDNTLLNLIERKQIDSKMNTKIKPLRFKLAAEETYNFYKQNPKFASYILEDFYTRNKDSINEKLAIFESLKKAK